MTDKEIKDLKYQLTEDEASDLSYGYFKMLTVKTLLEENEKLKAELELYKGSLHKEHEAIHRANDLETNWNELKKWLEEQEKRAWDEVSRTFGYVLDKMTELEGDKE